MRPQLDRAYDLSRSDYYADFFAVPLAAVAAMVWLYWTGRANVSLAVNFGVVGFATWTLIEYWVHRLVFHSKSRYAIQHQLHHVHPHDFIGVSPFWTAAILALAGFSLPWA